MENNNTYQTDNLANLSLNDSIWSTSYGSKKPETRKNIDIWVGDGLNSTPTDSVSQTDNNSKSNFNGFNLSWKIESPQVGSQFGSNSNGSFDKGVYSKPSFNFNSVNGVDSNVVWNFKSNFTGKMIDQEEGNFNFNLNINQQQQFHGKSVKKNKNNNNNNNERGSKIWGENKNGVEKRFKTLPPAESLPRNERVGGYIFVCNNDTMQENLKRQLFGYRYIVMDLDTIYDAAIAGDADAIAKLEKEANIVNEYKQSILHNESKKGNTEHVRFILREFANKNLLPMLDIYKHNALQVVAVFGHTEVAELLIDAARQYFPPADDNNHDNAVTSFQAFLREVDNNLDSALHAAVKEGNVAIVKLLVEADPTDRHTPNAEGKTPMYIAVEKGFNDIVEIICTTCTAPSLDGPGGATALHAGIQNVDKAKNNGKDVIRMIIDAAKCSSTSQDAPHESFEALFNKTDGLGRTILELAVMGNHVNVVDLILVEDPAYQHGRRGKKKDLMRLICKAIDEDYNDIVELLSKTYEVGGYRGAAALILAIKRRDKDSVLRLLEDAKHLVTFVEDKGWTPLHYAAYHEFDSILDAIIEAQKDLGYQFIYKDMVQTPILVAAEKGYTSTVIRLMELWPTSSSAYTAINNDGRNILHLAAAENKKEMIQGILKYCPEKYKDKILKQQDVNGDTPLHLLISHGCFIPELIKHKGLDTMVRNKRNWTPRDMLYFTDDIIADQVKIKIALDDVQTNQSRKFWRKNMKKKTNILESLVLPSKRETKDVKFDKCGKLLLDEKRAQMKKDLGRYKKRTSTQIVVAALITTVTFTVGFTMPGGLHQSGEVDEGLVVLTKKAGFNAFMVSDALAFLLSTCSLFLYFLESMYEDPHQVSKLNAASVGLNIVSVMAMMLTFITGTYVVLSHSAPIAITVCLMGSFFFIFVIVLLIKMVYDHQVERNED